MVIKKRCMLPPFVKGVASIFFTILLLGGLFFVVLLHSSHAFAATGTTCVQAPDAAHCDQQDPEKQGCAADAQTIGQADIKENGFVIGSVERRWSLKCQSWWGRVFDNRAGSQLNMYIGVADRMLGTSPTFVGKHFRILYSSMVFDATPTQQVPAMTGSLDIDGIITRPSATLPANLVPSQILVAGQQ